MGWKGLIWEKHKSSHLKVFEYSWHHLTLRYPWVKQIFSLHNPRFLWIHFKPQVSIQYGKYGKAVKKGYSNRQSAKQQSENHTSPEISDTWYNNIWYKIGILKNFRENNYIKYYLREWKWNQNELQMGKKSIIIKMKNLID